MSDDIVKTLERLALMAETSNHHIQDMRVMPAAGVADILYEAIDRIEELEFKLAMAVDVIDWALTCWDEHNKHGYMMHGDWVPAARTTLAELKGEK